MTFREPNSAGWWKITDTSDYVRYVLVAEVTFLDGRDAGLIVYTAGRARPFELDDRYFAGCQWEKA